MDGQTDRQTDGQTDRIAMAKTRVKTRRHLLECIYPPSEVYTDRQTNRRTHTHTHRQTQSNLIISTSSLRSIGGDNNEQLVMV